MATYNRVSRLGWYYVVLSALGVAASMDYDVFEFHEGGSEDARECWAYLPCPVSTKVMWGVRHRCVHLGSAPRMGRQAERSRRRVQTVLGYLDKESQ